jgi:hypothetical protein
LLDGNGGRAIRRNSSGRGLKAPGAAASARFAAILAAAAFLAASSLSIREAARAMDWLEGRESRVDARRGLLSLRLAYPGRITDFRLDFETGEWVIKTGDRWFCWADGRLLPLEERGEAERYRSFIAYLYPWKIIPPATLDDGTIARLKRLPEELRNEPPTNDAFATALYGGWTESELWARQRKVRFLGKALNVHEMIVEPLARVEAGILRAAERSEAARKFVEGIDYAGAYNYRRIRGQNELSRHSYGIAVDILPKGRAARKTYWLWVSEENPDWPTTPLDKRWMPPDEIIRIFEEQGFIWGGKWLDFDTMHFEYRPEMLFLREWYMPRYLLDLP